MQITDLLVPERVALNVQVTDKAMAIVILYEEQKRDD